MPQRNVAPLAELFSVLAQTTTVEIIAYFWH